MSRANTSVILTEKPSFFNKVSVLSASSTIILKIPKSAVSAIVKAFMFISALANIDVSSASLPSLFSKNIDICLTSIVYPLYFPSINYSHSFSFTSFN